MSELVETEAANPAAILRGTARGLEIVVSGGAPLAEIEALVEARLQEAPGFFRGCNATIRVDDGPLPWGSLGRLDAIAQRFEIRIAEVVPVKPKRMPAASLAPAMAITSEDGVPRPSFALGSAPAPLAPVVADAPTVTAEEAAMFADETTTPAARAYTAPMATQPAVEAAALVEALAPVMLPVEDVEDDEEKDEAIKVVVGPVRSGVILEHRGHLVIFGDVNPGAEVRAEGNIIVLGRLRGTAHAGIGATTGFILGLRMEPQQLRIGRKVARSSGDAGKEPEIAYVTGEQIIVERYQGRLPSSLAATIAA